MEQNTEKATLLPLLDCNARCPFCSTRVYTEKGVVSPADFEAGSRRTIKDYTQSLEEVRRTYDEKLAEGVRRFSLQGGEPTLWEDLPAILEYGRAAGALEQIVVSNGRRFRDPSYTARLIAAAPSTIVLSLFGACAETHDESMGVRGAFEDVAIGVDHLVTATQAQPPERRTSLTAQFSLHARNYTELPAMLRYWYAKGLRQFSIRLLRETLNTVRHGEDHWFFDMAALRAPLEEGLDFMLARRDAIVSISEIFYCLLSPSYFGFVMRDLGSNPNLHARTVNVTKHHEQEPGRRAAAGTAVCNRCDLRDVCVRIEGCYEELFSGTLEPIGVVARVEALAGTTLSADEARRLEPLLEAEDRLNDFGVAREHIAALRRTHLDALADDPDALLDVLLSQREQDALRRMLAGCHGRWPALSIVKLSELHGEGPLVGDRIEILARLRRTAPPDKVKVLEFLENRAECVIRSRSVMIFTYRRRTPAEEIPVLVLLIDDSRVEQDRVVRALDVFLRAAI